MRFHNDFLLILLAIREIMGIVDQTNFFLPWCTTYVLSWDFYVTAPTKLNINFKEARVGLTPRPIELHEDRRGAVIKRPSFLDILIIVELVAIELQSVAGKVDISRSKWSQIRPCHLVEVVSVKTHVVVQDHRRIALEDLEEENDVFAANIGCMLVYDELFLPTAHVLTGNAHIVELSAHGHDVVHRLICDCPSSVNEPI